MKNIKKTKMYENIKIYNDDNTKNHKATSNRNVNKDTNKPKKEKIYKNNKYIEMCIKIYKNMHIRT